MKIFEKLKSSWPTIRTWLAKTILKKIFPKVISGPWGWIVTLIVEKLFDQYLKPKWNLILSKAKATIKKMQRKKKVKDFEEAKNETDFDRSFDDLP